jgi:cytochrome b561
MTILNTNQKYGAIHMLLHWVMAFLIISLLCVGLYMKSVPYNANLYFFHKSFGVLIFILGVFRIIWKLINKKPEFDPKISSKIRILSQLGTLGLYGLIISMPVTGILMSAFAGYTIPYFGIFEIAPFVVKNIQYAVFFKEVHEVLATIFMILILIHAIMAIVHHFIFKDNTLRKMLPSKA